MPDILKCAHVEPSRAEQEETKKNNNNNKKQQMPLRL